MPGFFNSALAELWLVCQVCAQTGSLHLFQVISPSPLLLLPAATMHHTIFLHSEELWKARGAQVATTPLRKKLRMCGGTNREFSIQRQLGIS